MTRSTAMSYAVTAISVLGACVPAVLGQTATQRAGKAPSAREQRELTQEQLVGWYEADKGRRLTILPEKERLRAVFFWANGAPTSVGEVIVGLSGKVSFKQPKAREELTLVVDKEGPLRKLSIIDIEFTKLAGLEQFVGAHANEKEQTMEISLKKGDVYGSIDWRNNAPKTNGWLRAGANGKTMLQGWKCQEEVAMRFDNGAVESMEIIDLVFKRVEPPREEAVESPAS